MVCSKSTCTIPFGSVPHWEVQYYNYACQQWVFALFTDFLLLAKLYIATEKWDGAIYLLDGFLDFFKTQELPLSYSTLEGTNWIDFCNKLIFRFCTATGLLARCLLNKGLAKEAYTVASKAISEYESFTDNGLLEASMHSV